jgi:hypothetical protein
VNNNNGYGQIDTYSDEAVGCIQCDKCAKLDRDAADRGRGITVDRKVICAGIDCRQRFLTSWVWHRYKMPIGLATQENRREKLIVDGDG